MKTQQKETQTAIVELGKFPTLFYTDFADINVEQLEADLMAADQDIVNIKSTAEKMRQELLNQYQQRDAVTVRIP